LAQVDALKALEQLAKENVKEAFKVGYINRAILNYQEMVRHLSALLAIVAPGQSLSAIE
jgi:hypothetical protein